jgi:hypothetical protein
MAATGTNATLRNVRFFAGYECEAEISGSLANVYTFRPRGLPVSQRLLERLETENAQLRDCVVELMLEIRALHDGDK